jgi:hypothetical protein
MSNREWSLSPTGPSPSGSARAAGESRSSFSRRARRTNALPVQWVSGRRPSRALLFPFLALLATLLALDGAAPAQALTTISSSRTINASNSINDDVDVVGAGTVVTIVSGGSITGELFVNDGTTVNVSGGSLSAVDAFAGSTVNLSSGRIDGLDADSCTVNISGGSIVDPLTAYKSTISVFGCNLVIVDSTVLTGTLQDGSAINLPVFADERQFILHNAPPVITCPPSVSVPTETGLCGAHVTATATASANCPGFTLPVSGVRSDGKPLTDPYPVGTTTITWSTTDAAGTQATCTQTVQVKDTGAPTITLNGTSSITVECHTSFSDPGATANDACAGSVRVSVSGTVDANTPGRYTLTYTATDPAGNRAAPVTRTVQVVDTTPPVITPPANIAQAAPSGQCSAPVTIGQATATDACAGALLPTGTRSDGKALTDPYPVGTTTITWSATDATGNPASATQTVQVNDTAGPTISGLAATPNRLWPPNHQLVEITVNYTGSDNCAGALTWALSASSNEPDSGLDREDVPGDIQIVDAHHLKLRAERYGKRGRVYTLTITCTDDAGNQATQSVLVRVPK